LLFISLFFLFLPLVFSEIVDWTGKNFGKEPSPEWLMNFVQKKNDRELRKRFGLKKGDIVYFGFGENGSEEFSKIQAEIDAASKLKNIVGEKIGLKENSSDAVTVLGMSQLYHYWEEDENGIFRTYVLYSVSKENFSRLVDFNRKKLKS
ncbi:MAG: hypothetical protein SOT81_06580, partial [Treponema sp.]|nr:hypothetical protein [Treponema sp.]